MGARPRAELASAMAVLHARRGGKRVEIGGNGALVCGSGEACSTSAYAARRGVHVRRSAARVSGRELDASPRLPHGGFNLPELQIQWRQKGTRNITHFGKFSPLSTSYNFAIGVRVIRLLDFELQTSKLWFVSTAQNTGN
jgi:hypothetical protein